MSENKKTFYTLLFLGLTLFILRLPTLFELPGVDQTFFSYVGSKIREGQLLYRELWTNWPPGICFLYCWISYLGVNQPWIIPLTDLLYALLTLGAIFLLAKNLWSPRAAIGAAFIFILFSLSPAFQRAFSRTQPETLMNLPLILSLYCGYRAHQQQKNWPWFFAGLALGAAFIIKFTAILLALFLTPLLWTSSTSTPPVKNFKFKRFSYLTLGFALPVFATVLYLYRKGVLAEAYEALVIFNQAYATIPVELKSALANNILYNWQGQFIFIIIIFLLASMVLLREKFYLSLLGQSLILWILMTILSVCIQGKYFPYHFMSLLPPFSLLAGLSFELIKTKVEGKNFVVIPLFMVALLSIATGDVLRDYVHAYKPNFTFLLKKVNYEQALRSLPVNANKLGSWELGRYIARNSQEKDYIYVWGINPEIYYYSGRPSPNRYFYFSYYFMDANNLLARKFPGVKERQQELLNNLKEKPVKFFIVSLDYPDIFEQRTPLRILEDFPELNQWLQDNYFLVARYGDYLIFQKCKKETTGNLHLSLQPHA